MFDWTAPEKKPRKKKPPRQDDDKPETAWPRNDEPAATAK